MEDLRLGVRELVLYMMVVEEDYYRLLGFGKEN